MYSFRDVNETSESTWLPSEALKINGEYIENQITGYRTLSVSGREALSPELDYYETGTRDGSKLKSKRYPSRTIVVKYQLVTSTPEDFREAYNKLAYILDVEEAELIFNDETDKFYKGTPSAIGDVEAGRNSVVGEFEIFCADPFKYSTIEYEAEPWEEDKSTVLIDYNGTYKGYPILEVDFYKEDEAGSDGETDTALTGAGDCGFVAFFNEDEKIIQLGDPTEVDGETVHEKSQTLVNQTFLSSTSWGTTAKKLWGVNAGVVLPDTVQQLGNVAMVQNKTAVTTAPKPTSGTLLNRKQSDGGAPLFYYTITAKTSERTATTVKVNVAITVSLRADESYFGYGYGLVGSIYIGGAWHNVTLKTTGEYWRGRTGHTKNLSFTVSGLSASTSSLTGIKFKATRSDSVGGSAGILSEKACSNLAVSPYEVVDGDAYYLTASDFGSASGVYHGASITRTLDADASGVVGATDFTLTYKQIMCIGIESSCTAQLGGFQMHLSDGSGNEVAGVRIVKNSAGRSASLMLYVNGVKVHQVGIDLSYRNKFFGVGDSTVKTSTISKTGNKIYFNIGGYVYNVVDDSIKTLVVKKITCMFEKYSDAAAISFNGLFWVKFVKNNCSTMKNIPNKFSADDVLTADCSNAEILLNGITRTDLGALGNDWEEFYLTPGLNQIGISYSDWVSDEYAPDFRVRYREVYL